MFRRSVRIACLVIGLLVTAGVAYRTLHDEDALNRERRAEATALAAVGQTAELLLDVRASLHAYVAPGQGLPFWGKRAQESIDRLRQSLIDLDQMLPATDRFMTIHGLHYLELTDGSVRRARGFFDLYDAATQLGLLPSRGGLGETALLLLRGFGVRRRPA